MSPIVHIVNIGSSETESYANVTVYTDLVHKTVPEFLNYHLLIVSRERSLYHYSGKRNTKKKDLLFSKSLIRDWCEIFPVCHDDSPRTLFLFM